MKKLKKVMALLIAVAMVLSMSMMVFAAPQTVHGTDVTTNKGSITITNATVGKKYSLYKLFDATVALNEDGTAKTDADGNPIINYTVPTGKTLPADNTWFAVDANGNVSAKSGADITTDAFKTWAESFGTEVKKDVEAQDSSLTFDQLEFGYYYIKSEVGGTLTIDSTTPSATVIDKNQDVSFEKNIIETGNVKTKVNEAGLKEDVSFQIETKATNYVGTDKVFKYVILDTLEAGMTYKAVPTVKVDGEAETPVSITYYKADGTTVTENLAEAQKFEIVINWTNDGTKAGTHRFGANATILVEYDAFLDPTKADQIVVGGTNDGNTNAAQVKYFKGPDDETPDEETPSGVIPEKKTDTFTTELTILKQDQDGNALQGAEFTLTGPTGAVVITKEDTFTKSETGEYWLLKDGTYTTQDPDGTIDGNPVDKTKYASLTDKYAKTTTTVVKGAGQTDSDIKVEVGTDGKATFTGLGAGNYTLSETKVPDGYNKIADITFTITATPSDDATSQTGKKITFSTNNDDIQVESDNTLTLAVENQKGTELPSTGGIGTTIFYIVGAALVIGAGVIMITRRRMDAQ